MIIGIIQKHGDNDIEYDYIEMSEEDNLKVLNILNENCEASVRGTYKDIAEEISQLS